MIRKEAQALSAILDVRIVEMGDQEFSRGRALTTGSEVLSPDSLMFFTDVDMLFTYASIERIRQNTVLGAQVRVWFTSFYFMIFYFRFTFQSSSANLLPNHGQLIPTPPHLTFPMVDVADISDTLALVLCQFIVVILKLLVDSI